MYLDFAKAFDKVPHLRLIQKCKGLGIGGKVLAWIKEWLTNRSQRVVLNGKCSEWKKIVSGVPQGSVLGPTLFLIFINDIDCAVETAGAIIKKFADDTKCYMVVESEEEKRKFQSMLDSLEDWEVFGRWLLTLTNAMFYILGRRILNTTTDGVKVS